MWIWWIAAGGAVGSVIRYGVGLALASSRFPWATLGVNVIGSLALGFVLTWSAGRWSAEVSVPVTVGLLGGFTTFSTFSWETFTLLQAGRAAEGAVYVALSVVGGLAAALLGYSLGQRLR